MAMRPARPNGTLWRWVAVVAAGSTWACGSSGAHPDGGAGSTQNADAESADLGDASGSVPFDAAPGEDAGVGDDGGSGGSDLGDGSVNGGGAEGGGGGGSGDAGHADGSVADSGSKGGAGTHCKRGIASNAAPSAAFVPTASSPGIAWWYNWSNQGSSGTTGIEYVPMIWGSGSLNAAIPAGSRYLLGFNEPNFKSQADLTAQQAAADWPAVEAKATAAGIPVASPGVNF